MQKIVKSFGELSRLKDEDPELYDRLKAQLEDKDRSKILSKLDAINAISDFEKLKNNDKSLISKNALKVNYAPYVIRRIWSEDLKLDKFFYYLKFNSNTNLKIEKNVYFLVCQILINPRSILGSYLKSDTYLGNLLNGTSINTLYETLDFIVKFKDKIFQHINHIIVNDYKRSFTLIFYDCTNVYFETSYDDEQLHIIKANREIFKRIKQKNPDNAEEEFCNYTKSKDYIDEVNLLLEKMGKPYRLRGPSKELRHDLPIICIALVIDERGIAIDCMIYPGNESEKKSFIDSIQELSKKYNITNAIMVGDNGINTTFNMKYLKEHGFGFAVAQSALSLNKKYHAEMLELEKYTQEVDANGEKIDFFYRIMPFRKTSTVKTEDGKNKKIFVDCQILYTYSESKKKYELHRIEEKVKKASEASEKCASLQPQFPGYKQYCKSNVDPNDLKATGLKDNLIDKHRKVAGFSSIIFYNPKKENNYSITDAKAIYHMLLKIEEAFRIMKHNFKLRPVYLRDKDRIYAHIILNVISFIILRIIEIKCSDNNIDVTTERILESFKNMILVLIRIKDKMIYINPKEANFDNAKHDMSPNLKDDIMRAIGCTPLEQIGYLNDIRNNLHIRKVPITNSQHNVMDPE